MARSKTRVLITLSEAAEILLVKESTVRSYAYTGLIKSVKNPEGRGSLYDMDSVVKYSQKIDKRGENLGEHFPQRRRKGRRKPKAKRNIADHRRGLRVNPPKVKSDIEKLVNNYVGSEDEFNFHRRWSRRG